MSLIDRLWDHVKATQQDRVTLPPPRATDLWVDLSQVRMLIHTQSLEIGDLREAVTYLADVVEGLQMRLQDLERGIYDDPRGP